MDLVCGYGLDDLQKDVDSVQQVVNQGQTVYNTSIAPIGEGAMLASIATASGRSYAEIESAYGWSQQYGPTLALSNWRTVLPSFDSFRKSRAGGSTAGTGMDAGMASRDTYFRGMGWSNYAEYAKTLRDNFPHKRPYTKQAYLAWVEGQKERAQAMDANRRESQKAIATGMAQRDAYLQKKALKDMGLSTPKSLLPIAIAGVGALLLLK